MQFHHIFISFTDFQEPSLLYNTNLLLNASRNKANGVRSTQTETTSFLLSTCWFSVIFHRYYILSDGVLFNVINCSEIDNGDDIISSELVRQYHAALLQWNLSVNMMLPCYSGICPPQTCTVRPWSTGSLVDNAEWPPDPEHTRCTCYREICVGNTPHSDLVCTGNQDLWKSNIIISDRKHFRFQRFHFN